MEVNCRFLDKNNKCQHEKAKKYAGANQRCLLTIYQSITCGFKEKQMDDLLEPCPHCSNDKQKIASNYQGELYVICSPLYGGCGAKFTYSTNPYDRKELINAYNKRNFLD